MPPRPGPSPKNKDSSAIRVHCQTKSAMPLLNKIIGRNYGLDDVHYTAMILPLTV